MPVTENLRDHRVLEVDLMGDTLVVIPAGDAVGFGLNVVNNEVAKVLEVAKSGRVKHLIIDLGRANYFGSVMIGEFMRLGLAVRERGGRIALAGASTDMQDVLRIMKLDAMWEVFPHRDDAVRAIARVPFREHLWRKRRWFAAAFVIAACVGLYVLIPRPQYDRIYYPEVKKLWTELKDLRVRKASDTEWEIFTARAKTRLDPIVARLERYASADRLSARFLLWMARDTIPAAIAERNQPTADVYARLGDQFLAAVEAGLQGKVVALPEELPEALPGEPSPSAAQGAAPPAQPQIANPGEAEPSTGPAVPDADSTAPASATSPRPGP